MRTIKTQGKKKHERKTGMEVYIGGRAQGKLEYVRAKYPEKDRIVSGGDAGIEDCLEADVIDHFHLFIRRYGEDREAARAAVERIMEANPGVIIVCDEIGCGIVPMERAEREYRELVGRIMCRVVSRADRVERLVCGLAQRLKPAGNETCSRSDLSEQLHVPGRK